MLKREYILNFVKKNLLFVIFCHVLLYLQVSEPDSPDFEKILDQTFPLSISTLHLIFEVLSVTRFFFNFEISSLKN